MDQMMATTRDSRRNSGTKRSVPTSRDSKTVRNPIPKQTGKASGIRGIGKGK